MKVGIIDIGISNIGSLRNSIEKLGHETICSSIAAELAEAEKLILPGVGSFGGAMQELESCSLDLYIKEFVSSGGSILGICLGMQLLLDLGFEGGEREGLCLVRGQVVQLSRKIGRTPHIGWNDIHASDKPTILMRDIEDGANVYFVHSYHCDVTESIALIHTDFYGQKVVAGFQKNGVYGVQFHPEKSQVNGMTILKNFLAV